MASEATASASGGVGFVGLLTIAFIVLKLTGVIAWSWWWALSPLLISWAIGLLIGIPLIILAVSSSRSTRGRLNSYSRSFR